MALIKFQNNTNSIYIAPFVSKSIPPYGEATFPFKDIDVVFNDPRIQKDVADKKLTLFLLQDSTPGSEGDAVLPFIATVDLPPAASNPGMMVYNTTVNHIQVSNGVAWFSITILPVYSTGTPSPAGLPDGYALWDASSQTLLVAVGGVYFRTIAAGVRSLPSHIFPVASSVVQGTILFDSDNKVLKVSDGTQWQMTTAVEEHSVHSLPTVTNYSFGAVIYVSDEYSLRVRSGINWMPIGGRLRFFALKADLPGAPQFNADQRGVTVYVNEDRSIRVWDGTQWLYASFVPVYKTGDLPDAADFIDGYCVVDGDLKALLIAFGGKWVHPTPVAIPYVSTSRPDPTVVGTGTMIFNTTSGKPNWSNGAAWVLADGTVDP